jgi:hypothetical protein
MKTLEYKLYLSSAQRQKIDRWRHDLRWVWNHGVELLEELEIYRLFAKHSDEWEPPFPLPYKIRWVKDEETQKWIPVPYTEVHRKKHPPRHVKGFYGQVCPLPHDRTEGRLANESAFTLAAYFAHKRHPDKPWLKEIPANFIRGVTGSLAVAWDSYKKIRERGAPKYKRFGEDLDTLINNDPSTLVPNGKKLRVPGLGVCKAQGLENWPTDVSLRTLKITCKTSGYYLQLTGGLSASEKEELLTAQPELAFQTKLPGDLPQSGQPKDRRLKDRAEAISFDLEGHHQTARGRSFKPSVAREDRQKALDRLQSDPGYGRGLWSDAMALRAKVKPNTPVIPFEVWIARRIQGIQRKLAKPAFKTDAALLRLGRKAARQRDGLRLEKAKAELKRAELAGAEPANLPPVPKGTTVKRTYRRMAQLHERVKLQRRNTAHKLSTFKVRTFGALAIADVKVPKMTKRPEPQPSKKGLGVFDPNGASRKSEFNRKVLGLGMGQFVSCLLTKAQERNGFEIVRTPNQSAKKIRETVNPFSRIYPEWAGVEPLKSLLSGEMQAEEAQVSPGGMPATKSRSKPTVNRTTDQGSSTRGSRKRKSGTTGSNPVSGTDPPISSSA